MSKLNDEEKSTLSKLTQIEETYNFFKGRLDTARADYKTARAEYNNKVLELDSLEGELEDEDDISTRLALRERIEKIREEAEKLKQEAEAKREATEYLKGEIDTNVEKIKALPGVGQALQSVLDKKYDRKIKEISKDKEKVNKGRERVEKLQGLLDESKTDNAQEISDAFKNMLDARNHANIVKAKIKAIDEKLADTSISDADKTRLTTEKLDWNAKLGRALNDYSAAKAEFDRLARAELVEFEPSEIDGLVDSINSSVKRSTRRPNEYDLNKGIEKQLARYDKESKVYDEQKSIYENAKAGRPLDKSEQGPNEPNNGGEEKLHFWNPFHWGKMRERAKQRRLEAGREEEPAPTENSDKTHKDFVKELQKSAMIDTILTREMRESNDRAADVKTQYRKERREEERDDK